LTCKPLSNKFPGSNWSVSVMWIEQSEVYDKVWVTKFCMFLTRRGTVTKFWFFDGFKTISRKKKKPTTFLGLPWEEYEKFRFFIMCNISTIWLGLSGHSLLICRYPFTLLGGGRHRDQEHSTTDSAVVLEPRPFGLGSSPGSWFEPGLEPGPLDWDSTNHAVTLSSYKLSQRRLLQSATAHHFSIYLNTLVLNPKRF